MASEDIESRTLGQVAPGIDQDRGVGAMIVGFEQRHHHVEPVIVLDRRVDRLGRDALLLADQQVQSLGPQFVIGNPDEGHHEGDKPVLALARIARTRCRYPARADDFDVTVAQTGQAHQVEHNFPNLIAVVGYRHPQFRHAGLETFDIFVDTKEPPLPGVGHVVGRIGMQKTPVHQRDLRVGDCDLLPLDKSCTL